MRNYSHSASGIDERTNMNKDNVSLWIRIETPVLLHRMFMLWYGCLGFTPAGEPQGAEIGRNKKKMDDLLLPAYQKLGAQKGQAPLCPRESFVNL